MFAGKPIIGLAGGIGSGKSYVARCFGEMGCCVVDSDASVRSAYQREDLKATLRQWWGGAIFNDRGDVDRSAVANRVFASPEQRERLEKLIHPFVEEVRITRMKAAAADPNTLAFVWDTPLLFEAGLSTGCDKIVFVDAPVSDRLKRLLTDRGWDEPELIRREKFQWPLDKKRKLSQYVVSNTCSDNVRSQVREILSQILAKDNMV